MDPYFLFDANFGALVLPAAAGFLPTPQFTSNVRGNLSPQHATIAGNQQVQRKIIL
jgi:hypothetical protein